MSDVSIEARALMSVIEAISSLEEDSRDRVVQSAVLFCKGRPAISTPKRGRPVGSKNGTKNQPALPLSGDSE